MKAEKTKRSEVADSYPFKLRCNGARCSRALACQWYHVKRHEAFEQIKAVRNCKIYEALK